jgi:hypothetical protein
MKIKYIGINCVDEDTVIVFINANTIKINGNYYQLSGCFVSSDLMGYDFTEVQKLSGGYIQAISWEDNEYSVTVSRKYTQNNAAWCDLGMVDVSSQYTNEDVIDAVLIQGV